MNLTNKKILFIVPALSGGGAERVSAELCNYFHLKGLRVSILETEVHKSTYNICPDVACYSLGCHGTTRRMQIIRLLKLKNFLYRKTPDILIALGYPYNYLNLIGLRKKFKMVLSERNYPKVFYTKKEFRLVEKLYSEAEKVVFQTPDAMNCFNADIQRKAAIIPNPLNPIMAQRKKATRRIVSCGRLCYQKNFSLLIEAFSLFRKENHLDFYLDIYGDGDLKEELMQKTVNLGVSDCVRFFPFSDSIHEEIADAAVYVSSSDYEGIQNTLLEAMAMGIPCVATDCLGGGASFLMEGGKRGSLVPRGNAIELAKAITHVIDDMEYAKKISTHGSELEKIFSSDKICQAWLDYISAN